MQDPISQPFQLCGHSVPGYWKLLLPEEALNFRLPRERRSTCSNCPMACFQSHDPLYRCCAYHPQVPNFLLGLAAESQSVKTTLEGMDKLGYLVPEGFLRSPGQWIDYLHDLHENRFDSTTRVKCPLLEVPSGMCRIYAFRNGVCSTFFCLNDHGGAGDAFWMALEEVVSYTEVAIGQWALARCGFDVPAYYQRLDSLASHIDDTTDPKTRGWSAETLKFLWGEQTNRIKLFTDCAAQVSENRDRLWEIARAQNVLEAPKFDKAGILMVPKELEDEIDPSDLEESDESMTLDDLWDELLDYYAKLWEVPKQLVLSPRAVLGPNPKNDKESQAFGHLPFQAIYLKKKGGKTPEWRQFLSESEFNALRIFEGLRKTDSGTLAQVTAPDLDDARAFLAEWRGKGFLVDKLPRATR